MSLQTIDRRVINFMRRYRVVALRAALAIVFVWFGLLKPLGLSPVDPLVMETVELLPVFDADQWLIIVGWWEVAIGLAFIHPVTTRVALILLALHLVGTFMPLFVVPQLTFQEGRVPYGPTLQGQYIFKNFILIAAALAVGGTLEPMKARRSERAGDAEF